MSTVGQPFSGDPRASRAQLTRAWAGGLRTTTYVPLSGNEIDGVLGDLLSRLIDALGQAEFSAQPATGVGAALVARGFVGEQSLGRTVEILGPALPAQPELSTVEGLPGRVGSLLGALACGYNTAFRRRLLDQQEDVKRALLRAGRAAERERRASEAGFREVFDSAPMGIVLSKLDGTITDTNDALTEILRYPPATLTGRAVGELVHPDDAVRLATAYQEIGEGRRSRFRARVKLLAAKGDTTWAALAVSLLRDAEGNPAQHVTMIEDVTDTHLLEQQLRHQTLHDLLTELPNQEYFWIHLKAVLERAGPGATITLCKIDLDGFAVVNDGHGHDAGNLVLRSVTRRLQRLVAGPEAMVARFGADEFAIVIEDAPNPPDLATLAKEINSELAEPVYLGDYGLSVSAGIGLVRRPARGIAAAELVRAADTTLHRAKRIGRAQWGLDDPPADAAERARYRLATAMPAAWENGQVSLRYQPLVRLDPAAADAGEIVAVQALVHWEHPERGVLASEECVALAEQTGLVLSIGPWLLRQACAALRGWRDQLPAGAPPVRVDLTTHLAQDPDLVAILRGALHETRLRPWDVQLGIPVELVVEGRGAAEDNLRTLAEMGVWTVLTRYGQAVGNLVTLESQPVRAVDITDQLVHLTGEQPASAVRAALTTLVPLIRSTGTAVVVAGVDSPEQADWWRSIGADSARGAAFAPPTTPEQIPALLLTRTDKADGDRRTWGNA